MTPPNSTRSTTFAVLALMGLVGGLGTGLHALVDRFDGDFQCWLNGVPSCCAVGSCASGSPLRPSAASGESLEAGNVKRDAADCPICTLLARYHATPGATLAVATESLLAEPLARAFGVILEAPWAESCRPRGPPSLT